MGFSRKVKRNTLRKFISDNNAKSYLKIPAKERRLSVFQLLWKERTGQ